MKATKAEERGLITLLTRIYREIHAIESAWGIRAGDGDFRPRIDYFHDAVRALTARDPGQASRLCVEMLAYDIRMLRFIQSQPWKLKASGGKPASDTVQVLPDAGERLRLADLYKHYALLFAALLSDPADQDFRNKTQILDDEKDDLVAVEKAVAPHLGGDKKTSDVDLAKLLSEQLKNAARVHALLVESVKRKKRMQAAEILRRLRDRRARLEQEMKALDDFHLAYVTNQLTIYEESRDMVKKMAFHGLNIVGVFVENAIREALQGGRGI